MTAAVVRLAPALRRAIVLRQVEPDRWSVEGYEQQSGHWRFTWLLNPADGERRSRSYATNLARHTGLPVAEQRLGERIRLVGGVLGESGMTAAVPPLTSPEVARIAAIAGRLSSDHDGEALSAARLFVRAIGKHGLRPEELIASALAPRPVSQRLPRRRASAGPAPMQPAREHQRQAAECLGCGPIGREWSAKEDAFLRDMMLWPRTPSAAQADWLAALVGKARATGGAA